MQICYSVGSMKSSKFCFDLAFCFCLVQGITVLPFSATREILGGHWPFGPTFCQIWLSIDVLYCTSSIYGLMFISIERYIGVTRPLRYPLIITHRRTAFAIGLAWSVAICVSLTPFLGWKSQIQSIDGGCFVNDNLSYVLFSCSASFYIPLIIIVCVYGRIYGEAVRQYRFLVGGEKQVRLKDSDKQEERVTLRVHIPQHLSTSTSSLNSATIFNGTKRISAQLNNAGSSRLHKFKRERKAGPRKKKFAETHRLSIFLFFSQNFGHRRRNVYSLLASIFPPSND